MINKFKHTTSAFGKHVARFAFLLFFFFFMSRNIWFFMWTVHGVHCLRIYKFYFLATFSLKMGHTILFTYLKIILLQYFSIFSFNFQFLTVSKRTPRFNDLELYYLSTPLLILYSILNRISTRSNLLKKKKKPIMQTDKIILSKFFAKK